MGLENAIPKAGQRRRTLAKLLGFVPDGLDLRIQRIVSRDRVGLREFLKRLVDIL